MSDFRQGLFGLLSALISALVILGSFLLSMAEGATPLAFAPTPTAQTSGALTTQVLPLFPTPTETPFLETEPTLSTPISQEAPTAETPLSAPPTQAAPSPEPPTQTNPAHLVCPQPPGWDAITVQPGDTLADLANKYDLNPVDLAARNCLVTDTLLPGTLLYVPGSPPAQPTPKCGPPPGWVFYTVQRGDTLYQLSKLLGVTVQQLQQANCMGGQTTIRVGQQLYVPYQPPKPTQPAPTQPPPTRTPVAPTTQAPTQAPPTQAPPTQAPPTQAPPPTQPPPPTQAPPPTEEPPPVTEPPVTPPTVEPPVTEPPVTEPPRPTIEP